MWTAQREETHLSRGQLQMLMALSEFRSMKSDIDKCRWLRAQGLSFGAIAEAMRTPKSTVVRWCNDIKASTIRGRKRLLDPDQDANLAQRVKTAAEAHERSPMVATCVMCVQVL